MSRALAIAIATASAALWLACDAAPASSDSDAATDVTPADVADITPTPDAAEDTPEDVPAPTPEFVLGVNETGFNTPEYFAPLPEGADLTIEFGPQGLWMVVLAFQTREMFTSDELYLEGKVIQGGKVLGELALQGQKLLPGGDGWSYYYNFFLVVDPFDAAGKDATVTFVADDQQGHRVELDHPVHLVGGP